MVILERPDPDDPTLLAVAEFDGSPPLELHVRDAYGRRCAVWMTERGSVLSVVELDEA